PSRLLFLSSLHHRSREKKRQERQRLPRLMISWMMSNGRLSKPFSMLEIKPLTLRQSSKPRRVSHDPPYASTAVEHSCGPIKEEPDSSKRRAPCAHSLHSATLQDLCDKRLC